MVNKTTLHNGIRVITQTIPHAYSVSIGIWVTNGSRNERPAYNGVSHFIEHLLFKGTEQRTALQIAREIDSVGGVLNAFTGREFVCYYAKVLADHLPKAVDLLSDIFLNSRFPEEEIGKERQVILQEIKMLEDNPDDYIHDLFHQNVWHGHPLGMPIIGTVPSVEQLTRDFIVDYKEQHYRADEIIIAAAGKVEHQQLLRLLNGVFDQIPKGTGQRVCELPQYGKRFDRVERDLEQVLLCLGTKALPQNHPRRFEALLLNTVLGGSMSSRLFQEVREKGALAYSIYSYLASHSDAGTMVVSLGTTAERFEAVVAIILREMRKLKNEPLPADELVSTREQIKGHIHLSLESSDNIMSKLAKNEIYFGGYQPLEQIMAGFDRVTSASVQELCQELFDERYFTLQLMGKLDGVAIDESLISL
ncbi:MAG TPA: pitrilysin family protein [Geobacteraceae bacterium]